MAASTPYVLAAGGIVLADRMVTDGKFDVRVMVATGAACFVSAGLDEVIPGFGKGVSMVLVAAAVLTSGPRLLQSINGGAGK